MSPDREHGRPQPHGAIFAPDEDIKTEEAQGVLKKLQRINRRLKPETINSHMKLEVIISNSVGLIHLLTTQNVEEKTTFAGRPVHKITGKVQNEPSVGAVLVRAGENNVFMSFTPDGKEIGDTSFFFEFKPTTDLDKVDIVVGHLFVYDGKSHDSGFPVVDQDAPAFAYWYREMLGNFLALPRLAR